MLPLLHVPVRVLLVLSYSLFLVLRHILYLLPQSPNLGHILLRFPVATVGSIESSVGLVLSLVFFIVAILRNVCIKGKLAF